MKKSHNPLRERTVGLFLILWMCVTLPVFGLWADIFHLTDRALCMKVQKLLANCQKILTFYKV